MKKLRIYCNLFSSFNMGNFIYIYYFDVGLFNIFYYTCMSKHKHIHLKICLLSTGRYHQIMNKPLKGLQNIQQEYRNKFMPIRFRTLPFCNNVLKPYRNKVMPICFRTLLYRVLISLTSPLCQVFRRYQESHRITRKPHPFSKFSFFS